MYLPKTQDTKDLYTLLKKGIFRNEEKDNDGNRVAWRYTRGKEADKDNPLRRLYDYEYDGGYVTYDRENIYKGEGDSKEKASLSDVLEGVVVDKDRVDSSVQRIVESRGMKLKPVLMGTVEASFYMGESYGDDVRTYPSYEITRE